MEKTGELDANGTLQLDVVKKHFHAGCDVNIDECLRITNEDSCEEAFQKKICVLKNGASSRSRFAPPSPSEVRDTRHVLSYLNVLSFQTFFGGRNFLRYQKECLDESHSNTSEVNVTTRRSLHENKCLYRCVMRKAGEIDTNGTLLVEMVKKRFPHADKMNFSECELISDEDTCKEAFKKHMCVTRQFSKSLRYRQVRKEVLN